jgi:hypothetical protein
MLRTLPLTLSQWERETPGRYAAGHDSIARFASLIVICDLILGLTPQAGGPQPSSSAGVEDFMLSPAPQARSTRL